MTVRKLFCLLLSYLLLLPAPSWSQKLDEQAQFYLQSIPSQSVSPGPQPSVSPGQLPLPSGQLPSQPYKTQPAVSGPKVPTEAPRQVEENSAAEVRAGEYGLSVKQFGYSFFYKPPDTFLPVQAVPVGPDYIIGPGDTIKIVIWGQIQGEYNLTVDSNGQISIPKLGVIQVSGLTYKQLREVLDREISRVYNNFQINVTLDNLRTIQIFVVGQARFPGSYAVSSLSTLISALFAAGGPSKSGSMRDIQVRRGKKVIAHFDMYDFLLRGDKSKDIRLQPQDVIFIPPIGPLAAIGAASKETTGKPAEKGKAETVIEKTEKKETAMVGGPIKIPGIFELKREKTLLDLVNLAGGMAGTAFKSRVQVVRVQNNQELVLFEDDLNKVLLGRAPDVPLIDSDLIKIFRVSDIIEKKVKLAGAVKKPGEFGLNKDMRVKELIDYAGGLLMEANLQEAEITRVTITPEGPETSRILINLRRAMSGYPGDNILLKPNDYLFVRSIPGWTLYTMVKIEGEIKFPGNYAVRKGETLSSLVSRAGGFTDSAYKKGAFFTREAVKKMQAEHLKQALDRLEAEVLAASYQKAQTALEKEEVERQKTVLSQQQQFLAKLRSVEPLGRVVFHLDDPERMRGTQDDLELQNGDSLFVPRIQQTVNVLGSVVNPTAVVYDKYLTVDDYIKEAGGPTKHADRGYLYVIKANGSSLSNQGLFSRSINSMRLDPGDSIIVPENVEKIAWLKEFKDIATIIGNLAMLAGIAFVALK